MVELRIGRRTKSKTKPVEWFVREIKVEIMFQVSDEPDEAGKKKRSAVTKSFCD